MLLGSLPSPSNGNLGPFHMYGIILAVGVLVGVYVAETRWRRRGYPRDGIYDIAFWVVIWGVIGARLYHVITDYQRFEDDPWRAFQIWRGGLGIWGAVVGGAIAVIVITYRRKLPTLVVMDCMSVGIVLAQAIGRWGNYFNQELFGSPTSAPWGLEISPANRPAGYEQFTTFHPTFLYESLWCVLTAAVVVWADRRFRLGHGRAFALYVLVYCVGRTWWESLRIDDAPRHLLGLRFNVFTAVAVGLGALVYLVLSARLRPGRETDVYRPGHGAQADPDAAPEPEPADVEPDDRGGSDGLPADVRPVSQGGPVTPTGPSEPHTSTDPPAAG